MALKVPVIVKRKRGRKVILAPDSDHPDAESPVQETMFLALARAHVWTGLIESGKIATITQLTDNLQLDIAHATKILHLANLAPQTPRNDYFGPEAGRYLIKPAPGIYNPIIPIFTQTHL